MVFVLATIAAAQSQPKDLWWIFLVKGDGPRPAEESKLQEMQNAHIGNFKRLFAAKKLVAAGPLQDPTKFKRGIVVLTVGNKAEVQESFLPDPYVQGKIMEVVTHRVHVEFGHFETQKIDPEGIEENRIVIFTKNPNPPAGPYAKSTQGRHLEHVRKDGKKAGLSIYLTVKDDPEVVGIALFKGKDDAAIQEWLDSDPQVKPGFWVATKMPQWLAKGVLALD